MPERYVDIDRRTPMLLPVDMREWVARDALARLIIDAIEQCDLRRAVTNDRGTGSPQYPPGMMVSLLIYAYAHGVFSSRRIEQLTYENLSVRYLCANTHPDHDTIAKFRRENGALFQDCMRTIILLGQELGMVQLGILAVDGTRLQANANRHRFATRKQLEQQQASLDELIKVAVQDPVHITNLKLRPVVFDHLIRVQHVAADLAAEGDVLFLAAQLLHLRLLLLEAHVVEARLEDLHRRRAVLVLRAFVLTRHDDAGRDVRNPDRRIRNVHVLAACTTRPKRVYAKVLVVDLDIDVFRQLGPDEDRGE